MRILVMVGGRHARGAVVNALRQAQGATLEMLAGRAGLSPSYLSRIERGERTASVYATERLAEALGVGPIVLIGKLPPLRALRKAIFGEDYSLAELAEMVDADPAVLHTYELGRCALDEKTLRAVAGVLRIDPAILSPGVDLHVVLHD